MVTESGVLIDEFSVEVDIVTKVGDGTGPPFHTVSSTHGLKPSLGCQLKSRVVERRYGNT